MEQKITPKEIATSFLKQIIAGEISEAYKMYVHSDFRHHNPYFLGDAQSLAQGMEENEKLHPHKKLEIHHVIGDEDLVAVHSCLQFNVESPKIMVIHLFRIQDEKIIIELWDIAQVAPEESVNTNGLF